MVHFNPQIHSQFVIHYLTTVRCNQWYWIGAMTLLVDWYGVHIWISYMWWHYIQPGIIMHKMKAFWSLILWCHWYDHAIWIACINWYYLLPGLFCHWWHVNVLFESLIFHDTIGFEGSFNLMIPYLILPHTHTLILSPLWFIKYLW